MAKFAELPDGTRLEFPDDVAPEVMDRVVKSHLSPQPKAEPATRQQLSQGAKLKFGPLDTGIDIPPALTEGLAGMGRRFLDIATLGNRPMREEAADRALDESGYATAGSALADLSTLVGGGAVIRGIGTAPAVMRSLPRVAETAKTVGQSMLAPTSVKNAAAAAGLYGAATTEGGLVERATAGGINAAIGGVGQAIPNVIGAALKPRVADDVAQLASKNIRMTPGQILGGRADLAEQKLMSLPLVGDAIANARGRSLQDFNKAVADEVLSTLGTTSKSLPGRDLVRETQRVVSSAYDEVLPRITATYDDALNGAIDTAKQMAAESGKAKELEAVLNNRLFNKFGKGNTLTGEAFKEADSLLGEAARKYRSSADALSRDFADAIDTVRTGLRSSAQGSADDLAKLKAADTAYAKLVRMENAAAMRGAKGGVFTPAQFASAVEKGAGRKAKAAGTEFMGEFADTAERRLSTQFPESGTAARLMMGGGLLGAGYVGNVDPGTAGGAAALLALYTRPGQAVLRGAMTKRPDVGLLTSTAESARRLAPAGGLLSPYLLPIYAGQE